MPAGVVGCRMYGVFFNDTATTEIYTLSLHDALPISRVAARLATKATASGSSTRPARLAERPPVRATRSPTTAATASSCRPPRSEEHTSELQSRQYLVCRLLLEEKNKALPLRTR